VSAVATTTGSGIAVRQWVGLIAAPLVCVALWYAPTHDAVLAQRAIAIAALMIVLWITEAVDHAVAGFIGLFLFWAAGVGPVDRVFSGFAGETPWFLLGAMLIGAMASKSGLARRVAYGITARTGGAYSRLLLGFVIVDVVLTFLVPSGIARVTILGSIAVGVIDAFKVPRRSNIGRGLLIIITYSAALFDKMVIAGAASILARGIITEHAQVPVLYSQWFVAYLPCTLITIAACWGVILWLYPPEKTMIDDPAHLKRQLAELGPWTAEEKRCAFFLGLAVTLWMTDFIHHLSPALIGIAVGLLGLMPRVGLLEAADIRKLNFIALWFTAAALSMGRMLQASKGLSVLTEVMTAWMGPLVTGPLSSAVFLYWTAFVYHFFLANETAMLSTSLPVVLDFAAQRGLDQLATGMIWTFASGGKIFVYQSAVLIVGYSYGCFEAKDMLKVGFALTVVESVILFLLVPLYWPLIGIG
jgi:sodium-dependent dicarboxylate transporter 2/3/5